MTPSHQILVGDCIDMMRTLPDQSVQCCVTSPPYFGLRDYGVDGQIGLEQTPVEFIERLVEVFREVRRVLRDDGTAWVNMGDSYAGSRCGGNSQSITGVGRDESVTAAKARRSVASRRRDNESIPRSDYAVPGCKPKDMMGMPWRLAFALQRKQEERKRNKMAEEQRLERLLSRRITTDLFHNTDAALKRSMQRTGIEEDQDLLTRLIHAADRMTDEQLAEHIRIS